MTQEEFKRKRAFGRKYSCAAALFSKVICGVCGGVYGIKIAHPREKYRSIFWKCLNYYDGGTHSPSIQDRIIRSTLHRLFKKRISKRSHILANCSLLLSQICENDIRSDFIRKFLAYTQTLWTDEWLLRTLVDRIIVQPDGTPEIHFQYPLQSHFSGNKCSHLLKNPFDLLRNDWIVFGDRAANLRCLYRQCFGHYDR